jgi:thiopurine S-methyltransferase
MDTDFWLERWRRNEIGFHQRRCNEYLVEFWPRLGIDTHAAAFVPLCGKSLDMRWLREHAGHPVLGIEIARNACSEFFSEWNIEPTLSRQSKFEVLEGRGVKLLCGDFFDLQPADVESVGAVFDRAALIALPRDLRVAYVKRLRQILPSATPILLVAPDYAQHEMSGPPFAVGEAEVRELFMGCAIDQLLEVDITAASDNARFRQRGLSRLVERVFRITPS